MKSSAPTVLVAGPVNIRASLELALGQRGVRVLGCSFADLIATCAGSSPSLVVLAGSMKGVELGMAATTLADHAATRFIPIAILTAEPGAPPTRRPDAAPLTLVLSHQGIDAVATRLAELAQGSSVPQGQRGVAVEPESASKSGGEPPLDDRLSPFLVGEPTEDTGSGPIRALHLHAAIANEPSTNVTRSRDWTWEDSPQGTALTDENDDQKAAKQRRLARTMMGVAPQGTLPGGHNILDPDAEDGDMPAPAASRAGAWGTKSDSVAPTGFPPARPLARAALRKAEPSSVGPLPGGDGLGLGDGDGDEAQAPLISPIVGPPRTVKPRPKTMLGVGLPSPGGAPAPLKPAAKPRPRTMLGLGLGVGEPAPSAPSAPTRAPLPTPAAGSSSKAPTSSPGTLASPSAASPMARTPKFTPARPMPAVTSTSQSSSSLPAVTSATPGSKSSPGSLPAVPPSAAAAVPAAAVPAAAAASSAPAEGAARKTGSPGPRRSANRTIMGGLSSPLTPPPPVNLPSSRPDDTAIVPTESQRPAARGAGPTGPAAAQFGGAAATDFTDEPTVVGDSAKRAGALEQKGGAASNQLSGADDFDDFDLGLDQDDATQVLDQSSIAAAKLEALRAKSARPDTMDFDTLPPPAEVLSNKRPNVEDEFENAQTEPPPPGIGIDGRVPEGALSMSDALELEDFDEPDMLGRTLDQSPDVEELLIEDEDDGPVLGGAAHPGPAPARPQGYQQSHSGTEEDTEIVAGLTKKLDKPSPASSGGRGWVWATVALVGVGVVAAGAWYVAPSLLGTVAHSEDTVAQTPVPPQGELPTPTPGPEAATQPGAPAQPGVPAQPEEPEVEAQPEVPELVAQPDAPAPEVVAEAATPPAPTPEVAPPTPTPAPTVNTAGLPSDPVEASAALLARGQQQAQAGDRAGAEASLRRALTLNEENYEAMSVLAEVLVATGRNDEALTLAQTAVRRRARVGRYHLVYGDVRAAMGDRPGASRSWSRAADVDPALASEVARRRN